MLDDTPDERCSIYPEERAMLSDQQKQALKFFEQSAQDWGRKALGHDAAEVNIIKQRNDFVVRVAASRPSIASALDVGCGTGDLVCDLGARGIRAVGVDFAPEMVRMSRERATKASLHNVAFTEASIFDYDWIGGPFDLVSANGFIEYISFDQLNRFLDLAHRNLSRTGSIVLGSRNRLFNLVSFNDFTEVELREGTYEALAREAIAVAGGADIQALAQLDTAPWPEQGRVYTRTGVDVASRYQYTPAQLVHLLKERGYAPSRIGAAHVHPATPAFKDAHREVHARISEFLQDYAWEDVRLVPHASTFMIQAEKT
jgi:SAM-dependent methyltransferase